ncbi:cation transporter [Rhodosalinus halophilus]|uniref:Cation transporter n=1 Tax=Rhodosalinus halophilus TaxID=2259333 RepID=A0A365U3K8_9RHOB|nr:copper-binding protein [Rhodosalinus halophilus]RBI82526.1 cation transporter [Rhodosalinus halophilus]
MKTLTLTATLGLLTLTCAPALAQMDHGMDHSTMAMSDEAVEDAVHASAVVNSIGEGMANVTHDPIPEIGWPAMTMDLPLLENAEMMGDISAGDQVTIMLVKGADGMYAIGAMMPN